MQARHLPTLDHLLTLLDRPGDTDDTGGSGDSGTAAAPDGVTVVIARNPKQLAQLRCDEAGLPEGSLHTLVGRASGDLTDELVGLPPISLVIDTRGADGPQQARLFEMAFFLLEPGARWVAYLGGERTAAPEPAADPTPAKPARVVKLARSFESAAQTEDIRGRWRSHLRSSDGVSVTSELVTFRKGRPHLVKVRDADALTVLPRREPDLEVTEIARHEPSALTTHDHVDHGAQHGDPQIPEVLESPPLVLRRYDGAITLPASALAYHGRSVLPDSFRWHLSHIPTTAGIRDTGTRYARLQPHAPAQHLPGSYFHFGYNNPGHFGHLMTEGLAKLWAWDAAKADDPSLKILCRVHPDRPQGPDDRLETRLLPAYGIDPDDIAWAEGPVTVDTLYAGTPMWHNTVPFHSHERLRDDWSRLRDGVLRGEAAPAGPERIFITRGNGNRHCRNTDQVEALVEAHGYTVVYPGLLSLAEQVALFASARVVVGFGGAGMFNLAYAQRLEAVVVLNQWAYEARNEQLFAATHGVACHTFWSPPDIEHPGKRKRSYQAHQSAWEFDLGLSGELGDLLNRL